MHNCIRSLQRRGRWGGYQLLEGEHESTVSVVDAWAGTQLCYLLALRLWISILYPCLLLGRKMLALWKKSYDKPRQRIKKQRHHFANKGPSSQGYGFSSGHV